MTKAQLDQLGMFMTTHNVLKEYNSVWNTNVPFTASVNAFKMLIEMIHAQHGVQKTDTTGITEDKKAIRQKLEDDGFTITKALIYHASVSNDSALYKVVYKPRSEFTLTRSSDFYGFCRQVHKSGADHAAALLPLGVTATMLNDFKNLTEKFGEVSSAPKEARYSKKLATIDIAKTIRSAKDILKNQIDGAMELFRTSNEKFYGTYKKARIIVNSPTRRRALKISFFDSETGKPLKGVKSNIDGKKIRPSSAKGNNFVQHMDEGKHTLLASLDDYAQESVEFISIKGEMKKLIVKLKKK